MSTPADPSAVAPIDATTENTATLTTDPPKGEPVPYSRFSKVIAERDAAKATAETTRVELEKLRGEVTTVRTAADSERATLSAQAVARQEERDLARAGLADDEGVEAARAAHAKVPEKDRPPLADWWAAQKANPAGAPKTLMAWLQAPVDSPQAAPAPVPTTTTAAPAAANGAHAGEAPMDQGALEELSRQILRGDKAAQAKYKELRLLGKLP